ncbi:c-type cytochrome [Thiococcus pfennigii]|jgi:sulfide dehydrogenase cytochrome subunit|uniref:c-type cytochrome n=1 Tax=Thiococcus pfennigii TaxID=1057 RepID=UPI001907A941|nr:c-type cytochrome [Thiococcus pfennigii]MBK1733042.1 cytochrome c4 [Thiococcus pfennigii]
MLQTRRVAQLLTGLLSLAVGGLAQADDGLVSGADGRTLAQTCAGCHGTNGASVGPAMPSIGGMDSGYFVEVMQGFRDGEIYSTVMGRIAKGYSDEELEQMADYLHDKPFVPARQAFDAELVDEGRRLQKKYCEKCHADGGVVLEDEEYYILAGQWTPYLRNAMEDFREGRRPIERKMKTQLERMLKREGEESLEALYAFFASQQ